MIVQIAELKLHKLLNNLGYTLVTTHHRDMTEEDQDFYKFQGVVIEGRYTTKDGKKKAVSFTLGNNADEKVLDVTLRDLEGAIVRYDKEEDMD